MTLRTEDQPAPTESLASVPAARLGERLRAMRRTRKLSRRHVARRTGIQKRHLRACERGTDDLDDAGMRALLALYQLTLRELLPERPSRSVSVDGDAVRVGGHVRIIGAARPTTDAVLAAYVLTIAELRGIAVGADLALRDDDLDALAEALGRDPATIEERLVALTQCSHRDAIELRRVLLRQRVLAPTATLIAGAAALALTVGLPGLGATELHPRASTGPAGEAGQERATRIEGVDIGTAIVVERTPDGGTVERTRDE